MSRRERRILTMTKTTAFMYIRVSTPSQAARSNHYGFRVCFTPVT